MSILGGASAISSGNDTNVSYVITNSLRLRSTVTPYLNRTPTISGNRKIWTYSLWVKRGLLSNASAILVADDGTLYTYVGFDANDKLFFYHVPNTGGTVYTWKTSSQFRDPNAWMHIVISVDMTQAIAAYRQRIYVNNIEQTLTDSSGYGAIPQNTDTFVNHTVTHNIARFVRGANNQFDGYMSEIYLVDGQQLTPNSFGQYDGNGVWYPVKYSGTYGTNGFYLDFSTGINTTTLGYDKQLSTPITTGTVTTSNDGSYTVKKFTSGSGTIYFPKATTIEYLVVGGGGGGGTGTSGSGGGGGGAGGLLTGTNLAIAAGTYLNISVGAGGTSGSGSIGGNGGNSTVSGTGFTTLTAYGGGGGGYGSGGSSGSTNKNGTAGGSGGGGAPISSTGGSGTAGQGYKGGNVGNLNQGDNGAAGGGGAGGAATDNTWSNQGTAGGPGVASSITGTSVTYARGGDGGNGSYWNNGNGTAGTANTGEGGKGAGPGNTGGLGGSGVVILKYAEFNSNKITNGEFTSDVSGWTISTGYTGGYYITWNSGAARIGSTTNNAAGYYQAISTEIGKSYTASVNVSNLNLGNNGRVVALYYSNTTSPVTSLGSIAQPSSGTISGTFTATATTTYIHLVSDVYGSGYADFDSVIVKEANPANNWTLNNISLTTTNGYSLPGADITNGAGIFGNTSLPAVGVNTNSAHWPKTNATYTFSRPIRANTKIELYCYTDSSTGVAATVTANGGTAKTVPASSTAYNWQKVDLGVTYLSTITLAHPSSWAGSDFWMSCIIVDDVVLSQIQVVDKTYDWSNDNPQNNYANTNPLNKTLATVSGTTVTQANSYIIGSTGNYAKWFCSVGQYGGTNPAGLPPGKYYFEMTVNAVSTGNNVSLGVYMDGGYLYYIDATDNVGNLNFSVSGATNYNAAGLGASAAGDVMMVALDTTTNKLWFGAKGRWSTYGGSNPDPATGVSPTYTGSGICTPFAGAYSTGSGGYVNYGQQPFFYTPPTGFVAICTSNFGTSSVANSKANFNVINRVGTNGGGSISTNIDLSAGGIMLEKTKNFSAVNYLFDSARGINATSPYISPASGSPESNSNTWITSFGNSTVTANSFDWANTRTIVDYFWRLTSGPTTNTSGSITTTVYTNVAAGISVMIYNGNGLASATLGHGLGVVPAVAFGRSRVTGTDGSGYWTTWIKGMTNSHTLYMDENFASGTYLNRFDYSGWTSSVIKLGSTVGAEANRSGDASVMFVFAEVAGFSKFGVYNGNGLADGAYVYTGFTPALVMVKRTDTTNNWTMFDTARAPNNGDSSTLMPYLMLDLPAAENNNGTGTAYIDILSNGFKLRDALGWGNASGGTYAYMAFAQNPFGGSNVSPATAR